MGLIDGLLSVIYPEVCEVCGTPLVSGEKVMCLGCHAAMPLTGYHKTPEFNQLHERTMCHAPIHHADACFFYERLSPYSRLIHAAKYESLPSIGRLLAKDHARITAPTGFFDGIDLIVPVPLDRLKLIRRGYNQSHHIALGISDITGIPVGSLLRARRHPSQTSKNAAGRLDNARGTFSVGQQEDVARYSHILIVDDIITTGSTLCACAEAIHSASPQTSISILTLAATRLS